MKFHLSKYNNLTQRIIVAVIGVAILLTAIYWNKWTYFVVFFAITFFTMREFYKLAGIAGHLPLQFWGIFSGLLIFTFTFLIQLDLITASIYYLVFPVTAMIYFIKLYKSEERPFTNIAFTFLGIIYVAIPFSLIHVIAFSQGHYHPFIVIGILLLTWASDTGGYFAGTTFGKTKLFHSISPKKSWEGLIGGAILTLIVAFLISLLTDFLPIWKWLVMGVITVVTGTYGDLVESLFKRSIKIKDSGQTLPGHGGFLDRFDAMLLSLPFIAAFLKLF